MSLALDSQEQSERQRWVRGSGLIFEAMAKVMESGHVWTKSRPGVLVVWRIVNRLVKALGNFPGGIKRAQLLYNSTLGLKPPSRPRNL